MSSETFTYKGISAGKYIEGEIEAINQEEASFKLKEQKIIITNLVKAKKKGFDIYLVFIIQREDCKIFKIADDIDKNYKKLLTFAQKNKLKIICYDCKFLPKGIIINNKLKFLN